jgi:hypothetical protein
MSLFMKKKKGNVEVNGFSAAIEKKKLKIANWLNEKTRSLSPGFIKILLVAFCALFGTCCFYSLSHALRKPGIRSHVIILNHIRSGMQPGQYPTIPDSLKHISIAK